MEQLKTGLLAAIGDERELFAEMVDQLGKFLLAANLSIFTFPEIETGEVFWLMRQPDPAPIGKGATLMTAITNAGILP